MKKRIRKEQRKFQGIPVIEARASLHVQPTQRDIAGATQEDPENCAYARALRRAMECKSVFVFRTIAYVETLNEKGESQMERYMVKKYAREYLLRFDGGQKVEPGGFVLHRPQPSLMLDYKVKSYHRTKDRLRRRTGKTAAKPLAMSLRSGKGCVHFLHTQKIVARHEQQTI